MADLKTTVAPASAGRTYAIIAIVLALLAALPFIADAIGQPALTSLATRISILAIGAASLNLALGYCGLVSFGHAAWYGVGAYVVGIMYRHSVSGDPFLGFSIGSDQLLVTLPLAILISGLFALVLGALSLRTSGVQFIMITLAFAQMLFFFFVALKAYGGATPCHLSTRAMGRRSIGCVCSLRLRGLR